MELETKDMDSLTEPDVDGISNPRKDLEGHVEELRVDPAGLPLEPHPTRDAQDPLNWSRMTKGVIIFIVVYYYFMMTYMVTAVIPSFVLLEEQFDVDYTAINWTFAIPNFGIAIGPLLCGALANTYGRRPVLIAGTIIALVASGCTSLHGISYGGYMAARFFQGLGCGPASNVGLTIINDISFQHERGKRIGYWTMAASVGSIVATVTGGFLASVSQYWVAYHVVMLFAVLLVLQVVCLPETHYPRAAMLEAGADRGMGADQAFFDGLGLKRTKQLGYMVSRIAPRTTRIPLMILCRTFEKSLAYPILQFGTNLSSSAGYGLTQQ